MTAHHTIMRTVCDKLAASTAIRDWCVAQFSKGCQIQLDAFGAAGLPGVEDAPFLFVYADGENEAEGSVSEETFEFIIIAGVQSKTDGGIDQTVVSARTAAANGLTVNGIADLAETLRGLALTAIRATEVGAIYRSAVLSESGTLDYPLQWARARLSFFEPQTF
jgi:hypothetical protein